MTYEELTAYILNILKEYDPNMATEEATALRDLLIDPHSIIMKPQVETLEQMKTDISLLNYKDMSEEALDKLASNFIVERKHGYPSSGTIRVLLFNPLYMELSEDTTFTEDTTGLIFNISSPKVFTAETISLNTQGYYYYVDVQAEAADIGAKYNLAANSNMTMSNSVNSNVARVYALSDFSGGINKESNIEFYTRIKEAIAKRDLISARGASTVLNENFDNIKRSTIIGKGDVEMARDWIYNVHVGGLIDYYLTTKIDNSYSFINVQDLTDNLVISENGGIPMTPLLRIKDIELIDSLSGQPLGTYIPPDDYSITLDNNISAPWVRYSSKEKAYLKLKNPTWEHEAVKITAQFNPDIKLIQDFVEHPDNRTINANPLVLNHIPAFISFTANYVKGAEEVELLQIIYDYLLKPLSADEESRPYLNIATESSIYLKVSDIVSLIKSTGALHVDLPITLHAEIHHQDGSISIVEDEDKILIPRTYAFYPDNIVLSRRESE